MDLKTYENIIERESKKFSEEYFRNKKINSISVLSDSLNSKEHVLKNSPNLSGTLRFFLCVSLR